MAGTTSVSRFLMIFVLVLMRVTIVHDGAHIWSQQIFPRNVIFEALANFHPWLVFDLCDNIVGLWTTSIHVCGSVASDVS